MHYLKCSHPRTKIEVRKDLIRSTDNILKYEQPYAFCTSCKSRLPENEEPGQAVVTWFFIREESKVRALAVA